MKHLSVTIGLACAALTSSFVNTSVAAPTYPTFDVNPAAYAPGKSTFTANKITGTYTEAITLGAGTFDVSILWEAGQFVLQNTPPIGGGSLNNTGLGGTYGLYATFNGKGTFAPNGSGGVDFLLSTNPLDSSLRFYVDVNNDNSLNYSLAPLDGTGIWSNTNSADDILLGKGAGVKGNGLIAPGSNCGTGSGINCGSFGQTTTFALEPAGSSYFISPVPFYTLSFQSGQFNDLDLTKQTQFTNGSLDVVFGNPIPEPGSLALVGLALAGLGFVSRRRS